MKFEKPANENYCATVITITNLYPLHRCDRIQGTTILGNPVIIGLDTKIGDKGLYFPPETQLSHEFVRNNNLYRHKELNVDTEKVGWIEDNRRLRAVRLRGNPSSGMFLPMYTLDFTGININAPEEGDTFDKVKDITICQKYYVATESQKLPGEKRQRTATKKVSKAIRGQFRLHQETLQLSKNIHKINKDDIIDVSKKLHGTSVVISKVLCKKKISSFESTLRKIGINIVDTEYDNLYSSKTVIKNNNKDINWLEWCKLNIVDGVYQNLFTPLKYGTFNPKEFGKTIIKSLRKLKYYSFEKKAVQQSHYYDVDIWGAANQKMLPFLVDGMTIYAEIVGFLPSGAPIQKQFDYGCSPCTFDIYIYRITITNTNGAVFEFSPPQVRAWCSDRGLKSVPVLYYGKAHDVFAWKYDSYSKLYDWTLNFHDNLVSFLRNKYLERDCDICKNSVPAEGIVVRRDVPWYDAYKLKSFRFLELETKQLDEGEVNIEDNPDEFDDAGAIESPIELPEPLHKAMKDNPTACLIGAGGSVIEEIHEDNSNEGC